MGFSPNSRIKHYLSHYFSLLDNREVAYFLRCKSIETPFNSNLPVQELLKIHQRYRSQILRRDYFHQLPSKSQTLLDLKIHIAKKILENCSFCARKCHVNRTNGETGYCGQSESSSISSSFLHYGEENLLVPSGTIFFNGCTFDCKFCQNYDLSTYGKKESLVQTKQEVTGRELAQIATNLFEQGAKNINYVGGDPTPHLATILQSMEWQPDNICQLWNSNFYLSEVSLILLEDVIDLWLPDFKYGNNECARRYSQVEQYWDVIRRNFLHIYVNGSRNIIIRHLVMPSHIECCSKPILLWIAENIPKVVVNIMGQYRPAYMIDSHNFPEINRRVTKAEMEEVYRFADHLHLEYRSVS